MAHDMTISRAKLKSVRMDGLLSCPKTASHFSGRCFGYLARIGLPENRFALFGPMH
jgi:hypothetical protein